MVPRQEKDMGGENKRQRMGQISGRECIWPGGAHDFDWSFSARFEAISHMACCLVSRLKDIGYEAESPT